MTTIDHDVAASTKDRTRLAALVRALDFIGKSGHVYRDGDGFLLYVEAGSPRRWSNIKSRLAFCRINQDGDDEGCLHLDRLPTPDEAELIRDALGIRKRRNLSPETIERATIALGLARSHVNRPSGAPGCVETPGP